MKTPILKVKDMAGQTGKVPVVKVAKQDQDLRTAENSEMALNSLLFLPKVYAVKKLPASAEYSYEHGLGYPPMYLCYQQQQYLLNNESEQEFDPVRFIFNAQGWFVSMNSTEFRNIAGGISDSYLILFQDSLATDQREYSIDSKMQTLKVHMQGQFVCNLPSFNAPVYYTEGWKRIDWFSFNHNLGYPPVHTPFTNTEGLWIDLAYNSSIPSDFVVNDVNDLIAERWVYTDFWFDEHMEVLWVYVDKDKYYVGYERSNWDGESGYTFPARTVRVNYTIFNLPINEEFNLLS